MSYLDHGASSPAGEAQGIGRDVDALEWRWFEVNNQAGSQWAKFLRDRGEKVLRHAGRAGRKPRVSPGYMKEVEHIELLTKKKLQILFPEAQVQHVNFASALIAFHIA